MKEYTNEEIAIKLEEFVVVLESKSKYEKYNGFDYNQNQGIVIKENWLDTIQTIADWAGLIPGVGDVIDFINGVVYLIRGQYTNGILSMVAVIPVVGSVISIPLKTAFKVLPTQSIAKIGKQILEGSGRRAGEEFLKYANNPKVKNVIGKIISVSSTLNPKIFALKNILERVTKFIPGQLDDKLLEMIYKTINNLAEFFTTVAKKSGAKEGAEQLSKLLFKEIPTKFISKKSGRLLPQSGFLANKLGAKRAFFVTQDMFKDYLMKEGKNAIPANIRAEMIGQAQQNLIKRGQKNFTQDQLSREFTNLTMLNNIDIFNDFIKSPAGKVRWENAKKLFSSDINKDANGFFMRLAKSGYKVSKNLGLYFYFKPNQEKQRKVDSEIEKNTQDMMSPDDKKTGDVYGSKREM